MSKPLQIIRPQVLILGSTGRLASVLRKFLNNCDVFTGSSSNLSADVVISANGILKFSQPIKKLDVVLFGSSIDGFAVCESNPDFAFAINVELNVRIFQQLSRNFDFIPIVLSTDAVYSGLDECVLTENFIPTPLSVYGKTKRMFEVHVLQNSKRPCIVRMSKLWGGEIVLFRTWQLN